MYTPDKNILEKYAQLLVNFALNWGEWIKVGEVVHLSWAEITKPLFHEVYKAILSSWGHCIVDFQPDWFERTFFEHANEDQVSYVPMGMHSWLIQDIDHRLKLYSEADKYALTDISPDKKMQRMKAHGPLKKMMFEKVDAGNMSWSLCLYPTQSMASDANMSLEAYWDEVIHACYLDSEDPMTEWRRIFDELEVVRSSLSDMKIQSLHMVGDDCDLTVKLWSDRQWLAGSGCNIPSYEIFTSPDWRGTNGWIRFNQPLSYSGEMIEGVRLEFKDWLVTKSEATQWEALLQEMISQTDADKVGEYSLTDGRISRITKYMGETLYDENVWGPYGNTHIALGSAYRDAYTWDVPSVTDDEWKELWFNDSVIHTDIMSTTDRTVTATLEDGLEKVIYRDGKFQV